jgi:hypothetical protein
MSKEKKAVNFVDIATAVSKTANQAPKSDFQRGNITHWENDPKTGEFVMKGYVATKDGKPVAWLSQADNTMLLLISDNVPFSSIDPNGKPKTNPMKANFRIMV